MTVNLICIECPRGCEMTAETRDNAVLSVQGNFCIKGKRYAEAECIKPVRVLTTTIHMTDGRMLPVKTDRAIDKAKLFETMKSISEITASSPVLTGQVLAIDIDGEGANLVATKSI